MFCRGLDELKILISKPDTSITSALEMEASINCFKSSEEVLGFFINNIDSLLNIAMKPVLDVVTNRAFCIIGSEIPRMVSGILQSDSMLNFSEKIFSGDPESLQISKFAILVQILFKNCPKASIERCPFLNRFLKLVSHDAVYSLFAELLREKDEETVVFQYLLDMNLSEQVYREILAASDMDNENLAGLYRLVSLFAGYPALNKFFQSHEIVSNIFINKNPTSNLVLSAQWDALYRLCNQETVEIYIPLIEKAKNIINQISGVYLCFHSTCFEFVSKIFKFVVDKMHFSGFSESIVKSCRNFPDHSFAQLSAVGLALNIISSPEMTDTETPILVAAFSDIMNNPISVVQKAWAFKFFNDCLSFCEQSTSDLAEKLPRDLVDHVKNIAKIMESPYGGKVPKLEPFETMIPETSTEQLIYLLRHLRR